ncbi:MAG: DUF4114 domain-containing protein [Pseudomonadales bacterium]
MATAIQKLKGTNSDDRLDGTRAHEVISARAGDDLVYANSGNDKSWGGSGDDTLYGNRGNDILYGGGAPAEPSLALFSIAANYQGNVIFEGESAGYKNSLGSYKIDQNGQIYDVTMHFNNASLAGSGGSLIGGQSSSSLQMQAGDKVGFFIIANGFNVNSQYAGLDWSSGSLSFEDDQKNLASVSTANPHLWFTDTHGVRTELNLHIYHSAAQADSNYSLNGDSIAHVTSLLDIPSQSVIIGFEDLYNGGDKDFDDTVFRIEIGEQNANALLPPPSGNAILSDDDILYGGSGSDQLFGQRGDDQHYGGDGNDTISAGSGDDIGYGGAGADTLLGGSGSDQLWGDSGSDTLRGGRGDDTLHGGSASDTLYGDSGNDILYGDTGADLLFGGGGNDTLYGGNGRDTINAGAGDDLIISGRGRDTLDGGSGSDTVSYQDAQSAVRVDLHAKRSTGADSDTYHSIENARGGDYNDWFRGDKRDNTLEGGAGNDQLRGMTGADTLIGGAGEDTFIWRQKDIDNQLDVIEDFMQGEDTLELLFSQAFGEQNAAQWIDLHTEQSDTYVYFDLSLSGNFNDAAIKLAGLTLDNPQDLDIWS